MSVHNHSSEKGEKEDIMELRNPVAIGSWPSPKCLA